MRRKLESISKRRAISVALILFLSIMMGAAVKAADEVDINKLIQNANTPEEHINIAEYYERQAAIMEKKSGLHANMAKSYKRSPKRRGLAKHCSNLSEKYKEAAEEYTTMAVEHRKLAKEMQKMSEQ